jgi:hypothetical protein
MGKDGGKHQFAMSRTLAHPRVWSIGARHTMNRVRIQHGGPDRTLEFVVCPLPVAERTLILTPRMFGLSHERTSAKHPIPLFFRAWMPAAGAVCRI